jgi:hypothetical protein
MEIEDNIIKDIKGEKIQLTPSIVIYIKVYLKINKLF